MKNGGKDKSVALIILFSVTSQQNKPGICIFFFLKIKIK